MEGRDAQRAAWRAFGEIVHARPAEPTERLRRYAEACYAAGEAYHTVRLFGDDDG